MKCPRLALYLSMFIATAALATNTVPEKITIPAYFPLDQVETGQTQTAVQRILNQAQSVGVVVVDFNAASLSYANYTSWYNQLHSAGIEVLGYVHTNTGRRSGGSGTLGGNSRYVLGPVNNGYDCRPATDSRCTTVADWYGAFAGYVDGIFLDEGPINDPVKYPQICTQGQFYGFTFVPCSPPTSGLYQQIIQAHSGPCGGHACVMLNASQFPDRSVKDAADYLMLWERPYNDNSDPQNPNPQNYVYNFIPAPADQNPPGWYFDATYAPKTAHVVFQADSSKVNQIACAARSRGQPMVYVHDAATANYDHLSPFFEATVSALGGAALAACGAPLTDACGNATTGTYCDNPRQSCYSGICRCPQTSCGSGYSLDVDTCTCVKYIP